MVGPMASSEVHAQQSTTGAETPSSPRAPPAIPPPSSHPFSSLRQEGAAGESPDPPFDTPELAPPEWPRSGQWRGLTEEEEDGEEGGRVGGHVGRKGDVGLALGSGAESGGGHGGVGGWAEAAGVVWIWKHTRGGAGADVINQVS